METISLTEGSSCLPSGGDNVDALSVRPHMEPRMLYVTVGQHEDSYPFPPSRVSPLDPNLNSVQYIPSHQDRNIQQDSSSLIQYSNHENQNFPQSSDFSSNSQEVTNKSSSLINSVLEGIDTTHFSSDSGELLGQDSGLVQSHFNGYVGTMQVLNDLDGNLTTNNPEVNYSGPVNPHSVEQISLHGESSDYINVDPNYITQLNNGSMIVKQNMNGRYFQQTMNSDNITMNDHLSENISDEIGISDNTILPRISENLLSQLEDNEHLQNITLNRNVDLNQFLRNDEPLNGTKNTRSTQQTRNTFKKYVIPQNITDTNKRISMKSNLYLDKKNVNKKDRNSFTSSPIDNQLMPQNVITTSDKNSDSLAVSPIDLYENSSSYDFVSQTNDESCVIGNENCNEVSEETEDREDYLVVDGGLYSLNGFKTQGFLIEQSSGDLMVCQQLDGQLAIDQSMLDMKFNQMLNMNQDLNLAFNYDDQIILDQNGRILLKTEIANDLEKDAMITNDVVFNNLNITENLDQDLIIENDINDIDMKMNINIEDMDIKFNDVKSDESELVRKSKRSQKVINSPNKQDVFTITDKTVLSRAWASLPATYLNISKINVEVNKSVFGVFARRPIPERTQFGPLEGVKIPSTIVTNSDVVQYRIKSDEGFAMMDVSNENTSNWMRFVRSADNHSVQNLVMSEDDGKLYFTTIKHIDPKTELRVWYDKEYAKEHGFKLLTMTNKEKQELNECKYSWPCYECSKKFTTSEDLHRHLNEHDEPKKDLKLLDSNNYKIQNPRIKNIRTNLFGRKLNKAITKTNFDKNECDICCRTFPRRYSLKRHMQTHKLKNAPNISNQDNKIKINQSDIIPEPLLDNTKKTENFVRSNNPIKQEITDASEMIFDKNSKYIDEQNQIDENKSYEDKQEIPIEQNEENNKIYICNQCPKKFYDVAAWTGHTKSHPSLRCPMCEKSFTVVGALREHVKIHCINGLFTCNHCKKKFSQYRLIRKHIRAFHSDRKLPCPQCNKMFSAQDKLRMHLLRHSDHREFLCAHCGKQFKRKDKLSEHMKCVHEQQQAIQKNITTNEKIIDEINKPKKFMPRVSPSDYHRFIYKCHSCLLGFKRRGMLVNHLAKRHPEIKPESVPELNLPILRTTRNYYCQYCCKVYKSSSKRKAHILKIHPGLSLPLSNRNRGGLPEIPGMPNPTYSQTVGSVTSHPHPCPWCHKQYASKPKLLQHQRKKHNELLNQVSGVNNPNTATVNMNTDTEIQNDQNLYFNIIAHNQQILENPRENTDIHIEFDPVDPDDPACYTTDEINDIKIVQNDNYNNYDLSQNLQATVEQTTGMKFEKAPIVIDVTQLDQYRKGQIVKQQENKKVVSTKPVLTESCVNKPPKKWSTNFPFMSYPAR